MASKRKKRRQGKKHENPSSPVTRATLARRALEIGNYRDAVTHFKALLKIEDAAEWRAGLAVAYQGRARELAAKGMLKEALVIWDNRSSFCPGATPDPEHFRVLARTGRTGEAIRGYHRMEKMADNKTLSELRCVLAALYIAGVSGLEEELSDDDPVIVHGVYARGALTSWCKGDDLAAGGALAKIPFRSPYRDWVLLLKALMKWPADTAGAEALLQRVPAGSAFAPLARAAGLALLPDSEFTDALAHAGEATHRFAAALRGWTETRLKLWSELKRLGDHPPANSLAKIMHRHRNSLGEEWVQHHGMRLLLERYPQSLSRSPILDNMRLSPFHRDLVEAWHIEEMNDPWEIVSAWEGVIRHLRHPSDPSPGSDDALRIALIQRHLETKWQLLDYPDDPWDTESLSQRVLNQFEESLYFDPDDKPANMRLIAHYRGKSNLKQIRRVLEQALTRWPADVNVLGEALETAVAGGAYKKAAGYARRVLALDPINNKAIGSLMEAHLSHARKQLHKGRTDLAERELEAAAEWVRGEKAKAKLECLRGILLFDKDRMAGTAALHGVVERLGGLTGRLVLALEIALLNRPMATFIKKLGVTKIAQPDKVDFLCFLHELREAMDSNAHLPREVAVYFEPALKRAAGLDLTLQESEMACETLQRCGLTEARLAYARAALKRWPGQPIFELHAFEARFKDTRRPVTEAEVGRMETAWERAREEGDTRTAHRIGETLHDLMIATPGQHLLEEPPEELRELIDEVGIEGVMEAFEAIMGGAVAEDILNDDDLDSFARRANKTGKPRRKKRRGSITEDQLGLFE
jgi:tetratricopeptide (TPR) repeat protein